MKKLLAALFAATFLLAGCGDNGNTGAEGAAAAPSADKVASRTVGAKLTVKMLDVGQGDAILIRTAEQTVLIDTSDVDERDKLKRELAKENVKTIDKVILTHPHADHIGGIELLLKEYDVRAVYDNDIIRDLPLYTGYLRELKKQNLTRHPLKEGDTVELGDGAKFTVLYPTEQQVTAWNNEFQTYLKNRKTDKNLQKPKRNFNLDSIVGRLEYGKFAMLFTGDAEAENEEFLLGKHAESLSAQVIKVPHHGSKTSSTPKFLDAVKPETALISLGAGNDYGHPHGVTLKKYESRGVKIYRTDLNGAITITTDGKDYSVVAEKE